MKAAIVVILLLCLATAWGANSVYRGVRDRNLIEITCADYLAHPPAGRWVRLVECEPDFANAVEQTKDGQLDAEFIALRPRGSAGGPARLIVQSDDARVPRELRSFEGMMRIGFLDSPSDEFVGRLAREIGGVPNAVLLSLGGEPHFWLGLLSLIGGATGLAGLGWLVFRRAGRGQRSRDSRSRA